jgi:hypothetical protein
VAVCAKRVRADRGAAGEVVANRLSHRGGIAHGARVHVRTREHLAVPGAAFSQGTEGIEIRVCLSFPVDYLVSIRHGNAAGTINSPVEGVFVGDDLAAREQVTEERGIRAGDIRRRKAGVDNN